MNGDATRVRRPGGSIGNPSRQDPRSTHRHGSSHLDRVDLSPRVPRESRVARRVHTRSRHRFAHARSLASDACAFSRYVPSRRFAAPPRASPHLPSRLTSLPRADPLRVSRFAELRQDRRHDRRVERLHRDPQSDGARSFAAEPEGCGRRHRRHDRRRAQAQLRARLRTSPTRLDRLLPHAASTPSPHPAASPRSRPVTERPDRARSPIGSREIRVSAKTGGIFSPGSQTVALAGCAIARRSTRRKAFSTTTCAACENSDDVSRV